MLCTLKEHALLTNGNTRYIQINHKNSYLLQVLTQTRHTEQIQARMNHWRNTFLEQPDSVFPSHNRPLFEKGKEVLKNFACHICGLFPMGLLI